LISDFSDISAFGQGYELCRRTAIPMDEMKNADFTAIGRKRFSSDQDTAMMRRPFPWNPAITTAASNMHICICPAGR